MGNSPALPCQPLRTLRTSRRPAPPAAATGPASSTTNCCWPSVYTSRSGTNFGQNRNTSSPLRTACASSEPPGPRSADPSWATSDWQASTNELLSLTAKHKIVIFKDASANKGGVTSSSLEVLASLALSASYAPGNTT